jgi:hypothetical protein
MSELGKILKQFAEDRRELMEGAKKDARKMGGWNWHFVGRGIELIAIDDKGERDDYLGGPEFIEVKELTQSRLKDTAAHWGKYYRGETENKLAKIGLAYGLDCYDSFADYMAEQRGDACCEYTIWDDWAEAEIPIELLK